MWLLFLVVGALARQCLPQTVPKISYANTGNEVVFPTSLKVHSGGWDSQTISNMMLYILMSERMGLDVEFYPPIPNVSYVPDWSWYWKPEYHHEDIYWDDYERWLQAGDMHVGAEFNIFHDCPTLKTHKLGVVLHLGMFVPANMNDGPEAFATSYKNLIINETLQNITKDEECVRVNGTENCPSIIWGSYPGYYVSRSALQLLEFLNMTDTWTIKFLGDDAKLLDKINELTSAGRDFVTCAWNPSLFTAQTDLIPINWGYNPSGLPDDECVDHGACAPVEEYINAGYSSVMEDTYFVLMDHFIQKIQMNRVMIQEMFQNFLEDRDLFGSVCKWITDHEDFWQEWVEDLPELYEYETIEFSRTARIVIIVFSIILSLILAGVMVALYYFRLHNLVRRHSPILTMIWVFGLILLSVCPIILSQEATIGNCITLQFTVHYGIMLAITVPAFKAWRMATIFSDEIGAKVKDLDIYKRLIACAFAEFMFILLFIFNISQNGLYVSDNIINGQYLREVKCSESLSAVMGGAMLKFGYTMLLLMYAYKTRNAWQKYNESKWLGFTAVFMAALLCFLLLVTFLPGIDNHTSKVLTVFQTYLCAVILISTYTVAALWHKMENIINVDDMEMHLNQEKIGEVMRIIRALNEEQLTSLYQKLCRDKAYIESVLPNYSVLDLTLDELKAPAFRESMRHLSANLSEAAQKGVIVDIEMASRKSACPAEFQEVVTAVASKLGVQKSVLLCE